MLYRKLLLLIVLFAFFSCKKYEVAEFTDTPIIETYLQPGNYLSVKISRQIPFSSDVEYSSDDINNLSMKITFNNTDHILLPVGNGEYIDSSYLVAEGDNYNLSFVYNSKDVSAFTYVPSKPANATQSVTAIYLERTDSTSFPSFGSMPDPVEITWDNPDASYYLILVENVESTLDPIRDFGDVTPPSNIFRKQPTNSSSDEIRTMEFQYFGRHRIIIYHVLPDYASLYDQSSTSSQNLTNPSTSIQNGYGIFTGLNSDTLWLDVNEQ